MIMNILLLEEKCLWCLSYMLLLMAWLPLHSSNSLDFILLFCGLVTGAVSSSDYIMSN
jgi:hypothetical protein